MITETPIDINATRILGLAIADELDKSGRFIKVDQPFPHFLLKSDKDKCFGIDVSTIANPPRKGSHFYSMMFIIPKSLRDKYPDLLNDENYQQYFLIQNAVSSIMSKYSIMEGCNVKMGDPPPKGGAKKIAMEIRVKAMSFKSNYETMMGEIEKAISNYKNQFS